MSRMIFGSNFAWSEPTPVLELSKVNFCGECVGCNMKPKKDAPGNRARNPGIGIARDADTHMHIYTKLKAQHYMYVTVAQHREA